MKKKLLFILNQKHNIKEVISECFCVSKTISELQLNSYLSVNRGSPLMSLSSAAGCRAQCVG